MAGGVSSDCDGEDQEDPSSSNPEGLMEATEALNLTQENKVGLCVCVLVFLLTSELLFPKIVAVFILVVYKGMGVNLGHGKLSTNKTSTVSKFICSVFVTWHICSIFAAISDIYGAVYKLSISKYATYSRRVVNVFMAYFLYSCIEQIRAD